MTMFGWLKRKKLSDVVLATKRVKVCGVIFEIRKINPLDFASGSKAVKQTYDTYQTSKPKEPSEITDSMITRMKAHYIDTFMATVVEPKLTRKPDDHSAIWVEHLFTDWELATGLYEAIQEFTYGKKKVRSVTSRVNAWLKSTSSLSDTGSSPAKS